MESKWSGSVDNAFFNAEIFDRNRILKLPESETSHVMRGAYYVISVDVGRKDCDTVACVLKVSPQPQGISVKSLVNMYVISKSHFEDQAIELKKIYYKYNAKRLVIDGNGLIISSCKTF